MTRRRQGPRRVLLIDGDGDRARFIRAALHMEGCSVTTVCRGSEALALLAQAEGVCPWAVIIVAGERFSDACLVQARGAVSLQSRVPIIAILESHPLDLRQLRAAVFRTFNRDDQLEAQVLRS